MDQRLVEHLVQYTLHSELGYREGSLLVLAKRRLLPADTGVMLLRDSAPIIRALACCALAEDNSPEVIQAMLYAMRTETTHYTRLCIIDWLGRHRIADAIEDLLILTQLDRLNIPGQDTFNRVMLDIHNLEAQTPWPNLLIVEIERTFIECCSTSEPNHLPFRAR